MEGGRAWKVDGGGTLPLLSAPSLMIANIIEYKSLVSHFIKKDLKVRYHMSILGFGWTLVEPILMTAAFYVLFSVLTQRVETYGVLKIMVAYMSWIYLQRILASSTTMLESKSGLIQAVYFPREIFIFSLVGVEAVTLFLSLLVAIPLLHLYTISLTWRIVYLPISILLITLLVTGIGLITSIIQTRIRDMEYIVKFLIRVGFWMSPVWYTLESISRVPPEYLDTYLFLNPLAVYLTMGRSAFTGDPLGISETHIFSSVVVSIAMFWIGSIVFMRMEGGAVKYI